jgi:hypothetical protein
MTCFKVLSRYLVESSAEEYEHFSAKILSCILNFFALSTVVMYMKIYDDWTWDH